MKTTIDIIGAGIGGLTLAIALEQKGCKVRIFEQAEKLSPVGAGINLACNATQVYHKLGLSDQLEAAGHVCHQLEVTDHQLQSISSMDVRPFEKAFNVHNIAIHRGVLQDLLLQQLKSTTLLLGKKLIDIEDADRKTLQLRFTDGSHYNSECLIGADGIHSAVRTLYFKTGTIYDAQQSCWRGITQYSLPAPYNQQLTESWGPGGRIGLVPIAPDTVYWFAVKDSAPDDQQMSSTDLAKHFHAFTPLHQEILTSTSPQSIHLAPLTDLTDNDVWHKNHVCLIGDAAHATTPNMGQGACQAIEDAYVLAQLMNQQPATEAFVSYQALRQKKVNTIVKNSRSIGQLAHWQHPIACRLRNLLMRTIPNSITTQLSKNIYTILDL